MDDIEQRLAKLEQQFEAIQQRNARVEMDKAWETSFVRVALICAVTYLVAAAVMFLIGSEKFWLNALVPVIGFYLSQQTVSAAKRIWASKRIAEQAGAASST